jgi:hypothetical protein
MSRFALLGASFLAPVFLLASVSLGSADEDAAKASAASTFAMKPATGETPFEITTVNTRFETDQMRVTVGPDVGKPGIDIYQLVEIQETHVNREGPNSDSERVSSKIKATVYPLSTAGKGAAKFTIEAEGDESKVDGPYLTITRWGCCASSSTDAVYSLETGKYLFNTTSFDQYSRWADVNSRNFQRLIAYHAMPTEMDDSVLKGAPNAAIVISYASASEPLQRVLVTVPKELIESDDGPINWTPKLEVFNKANPKPSDHIWTDVVDTDPGKVMTGVTVQLTLDPKHVVVIPLNGDKLQLDKAKLPKGWGLVEAAL